VLVVGDSTGVIVGKALQDVAASNGLEVRVDAQLGCGLLTGTPIRYGVVTTLAAKCTAWEASFGTAVDAFRPDIVLVFDGFWDAYDWQIDGARVPFGTPAWDSFAGRSFGRAMDVVSSTGAVVVWLDAPYFSPKGVDASIQRYAAAHGSYDSAFDEPRINHLNAVFDALVAQRSGGVVALALCAVVCPDGGYTDTVGGVDVRGDGVHFTPAGSKLIVAWLLPRLAFLSPHR